MPQSLKVLIVEDNPDDAKMVWHELKRSGFETTSQRVDTEAAFLAGLDGGLDLILCDYSMPEFSGLRALELLKKSGLEIPLIIVSGTIGDEIAVEAMKRGAVDYLFKDRLARLGSSVRQALEQVGLRKERRKLEEELIEAQKMEAIGQLAGGVAHDFNNILASILLQVGLLSLEDHLSPVVMEGLLQIQADSERAANLTRQLLLFSRRQVMQPRILDLNEQVTGLVKMLTRIIGEDMRMELHLHPAPLLTHADAGMLDQVLMNLVVNSRDAMPDGGRVRVETSAKVVGPGEPLPHLEASPGQFVCMAVSDTGTGIPPEILPRIFEPFFTTKPEGKGTGMGLDTVYGIVKQHKGWIQVQSQSGQGATFQVFLPLGNSPAEAARGSGNVPPPRGSETILLVEDEPGLLHLSHSILERHGYQVLTAANAQEAFNQWRQHRARVTLQLTDLVMPGGCNGLELARRLRSEKPLLKVIFASGYSASIASQDFKLLPGEALLQKPFGTNQLLAMVRESLDSVNPGRAPVSGLSPSFPKPSPPPVRL